MVQFVELSEFGNEFDVAGGNLKIKLQGSLVQDGNGALGVDISSLAIVDDEAGNLLTVGPDGGAFINQAAIEAAETAWSGASTGFLTVTPAGTNGHAPTFALDFTDATFVEGVQDAVGQALLSGSGITYDDVSDTISSALGNLTFGNGLTQSGMTSLAVLADPNSPSIVSVTAAGISIIPGISSDANNLAKLGADDKVMVDPADVSAAIGTVEIRNLAGTVVAKGIAP